MHIMATAQGILDEEGTAAIPRAPPPSPELPHAGFEPHFDLSALLMGDLSEPTSPITFDRSPPTLPYLQCDTGSSYSEEANSLYPVSPPHDIPNGYSRHQFDSLSYISSSVPINSTNDQFRYLSHSYEAAPMELLQNNVRQRKISLKRNHDDLSDDLCYSTSCDPTWLLVEPPNEFGHKKACQGRDLTLSASHTSPTRHKKFPIRLSGRRDHSPPLVTGIDQLSIDSTASQHARGYTNSLEGNDVSEEQLMDCSDCSADVTATRGDSTAMDFTNDHTPFSVTAPSPTHLPNTRSHTFSFSPNNSSSLLKPHAVFPYTSQTQTPVDHQFFSSFHEQSAPLPDNVNLLSRSL